MNSDHAPTAELPPLDKDAIKLANYSCIWGPAIGEYREIAKQRENQLLAAIRENRNAESELAIARDLIATMRARIEELEAMDDTYRLGVMAHEEYRLQVACQNARYEAVIASLSANLRAVSDALDTELAVHGGWRLACEMYAKADVDARDARIRAILEGK